MTKQRFPPRLTIFLLACLLGAMVPATTLARQNQPVGTVGAALANVRNGPGTSYGIIGQVGQGTVLTITGINSARDWYQVCCVNNVQGWIWGNLLVVEGSTANLPVIDVGGPTPTPTPQPQTFRGWKGEYYANRDLQGSPILVRDDSSINFRWAGASPGPGVPGSDFSTRWTRTQDFAAGDYTFYAQVDDGVRLWLDDILIIDDWRENSIRTLSNTFSSLGAGQHTVRVEYFQAAGDAAAIVWWEEVGQFPEWKGEYFNDIYLAPPAILTRNDVQINFNWGLDSPDPAVPVDNFSVRWTRRLHLEGGDYSIGARTADGVRVYLDGRLILDEWRDTEGYPLYTAMAYGVGDGPHTVVVEYYARGGIAYAELSLQKQSRGSGAVP